MMQDSIYLQLEDEYCPYSGVNVLHCKLLMKAVMKERQKKRNMKVHPSKAF